MGDTGPVTHVCLWLASHGDMASSEGEVMLRVCQAGTWQVALWARVLAHSPTICTIVPRDSKFLPHQ